METRITVRIPQKIYEKLREKRDNEVPHMSLNALIVEAIRETTNSENKQTQR